ncbi:hypothetical protein [Parathalassolituus penaei]|uniref:Uncharacterized protein n=1 Tax=Parathalassolituus penaei TaxID=2997323 RepID=A0A9X3IS88_9GAMM|nr:hypothetical protein [Parathalassolituus penaei]MCY0964629.1 hypothetical protein [Parathalassolituus penaei]
MSYFSQHIQYPITCPACLRNTALNLSYLLGQTTINCRHCQQPINIERRIQSAMQRTCNELETYVSTTSKHAQIADDEADSAAARQN